MNPVITLRILADSSCPNFIYQSCELTCAKQQNPKVQKSKPIQSKQGLIYADKYLPGNFVSMGQCVVREPGQLPTGYNCE